MQALIAAECPALAISITIENHIFNKNIDYCAYDLLIIIR
jgi:hypothetical protein